MGKTSMTGGAVLFTDGEKLWKRFYKTLREIKKYYNPVFVEGQPGDQLPSGSQGDDAIEYLLDGVYHMESGTGNAEDPIELEERGGGEGEGWEDDSGESSPTESEDGESGKQKGTEEAVEPQESSGDDSPAGEGGMKKEPEDDTPGNGDDAPSEEITREEGGFPQRPNKWMHQYLLTLCLIGRPCSSEDPDLRTARKISGPKVRGASGAKGRGGKQKAKKPVLLGT
ncbi:unnamed protein product [Ectocarpus sp. CCAP 1310/34]|nr:unnamed protein product [Ectocarpus sp. CCAP 1310/34]